MSALLLALLDSVIEIDRTIGDLEGSTNPHDLAALDDARSLRRYMVAQCERMSPGWAKTAGIV